MAIQTVAHIANVSFKDHFLSTQGAAPKNGKIQVNHNTFTAFVQFAEQAGKSTGQAVDEAALAKIVKGAKFDKATVASLRATAKAANDAMRALDGFSGADFATAMVRDKQTGVVGWKGYWAFGNEALLELPVIVAIKGHRKPLPPADAGRAMFGNLPAIRV